VSERVEVIKIEDGARYAIVINGLAPEREADFADYMSQMLESWALSSQKFIVLTCPSGLELKFEKVERGEGDDISES